MLRGRKTGRLFRLKRSVQIGGAAVRHESSDISEKNGQGKEQLHRGIQSKRRIVRTRKERWSHDDSQSDVLCGSPHEKVHGTLVRRCKALRLEEPWEKGRVCSLEKCKGLGGYYVEAGERLKANRERSAEGEGCEASKPLIDGVVVIIGVWGWRLRVMLIERKLRLESVVRELVVGERGRKMKRMAMEWKSKAEEATACPVGSSYIGFEKVVQCLPKSNVGD
ncbi:hypothetical protein Acr_21g0006660 [Actinidia rufa]|uniref:Uncharacterized protein n=1 Tax=Actinidia rufa TaxID=165716 RepID=A0A7J0GGX3_9ERIC|nr:hypothetical protein Acr_21g0006660 [Actinidia rufa]